MRGRERRGGRREKGRRRRGGEKRGREGSGGRRGKRGFYRYAPLSQIPGYATGRTTPTLVFSWRSRQFHRSQTLLLKGH